MMRAGRTAPEALRALTGTDADSAVRQVAMLDTAGNIAAHTGSRCIFAAGHRTGDQYSVQANLMEKPTVWEAMAQAYEGSQGDLAERLLAALEAAEAEAIPYLRRAFAQDDRWAELVTRLPASQLLPDDGTAQRLVEAMRQK